MHPVQGADHSFHVLARSGRNDREVLSEVPDTLSAWIGTIAGSRNAKCDGENSTPPADAAQALVHRVVVLFHLVQRIKRSVVAGRVGLALGGKFNGLALITGLATGLGLDEAALLHHVTVRERIDFSDRVHTLQAYD